MRKFIIAIIFLNIGCINAQSLTSIDLSGHTKAKGLNVKLKYPNDWEVKEGERPNIVKKFVKNYSDGIAMMMFQVNNIPKEAVSEIKSFTTKDMEEVFSELGTVLSISKTRLEQEDAFIGDLIIKMERVNFKPIQRQRVVSLIYKEKWIYLWCGYIGHPSLNEEQIEQRYKSIAPQCQQFFNSFVLLNKYQN
jgi:hypothetical protein